MAHDIEDMGDVDLSPDQISRIERAVAEAERDLEAARVNFRWGTAQVEVIKRAAAMCGVPYQTYIKQVAFRQALHDLRDGLAAGASTIR